MNEIEVSIIIVSYNTKELTVNCIKSIFEFTDEIKYEIIIVDNASSDGTVYAIKESFPSVKVIESDENIGFGRANNLGSEYAKGEYLFFLNSDCLLIENSIKKMYDYFELNKSDNLGAVGCMLLDKDENLNSSYYRFPTPLSLTKSIILSGVNKLFSKEYKLEPSFNYPINDNNEVDFIIGADLFMSKKVFYAFSGFDPIFFLYYEETDLQKRMAKASLKRVVLKNTSIIHLEGGSRNSKFSISAIYIDSRYKYIKKHYSILTYILFYIISTPLLILSVLINDFSKKDKKKYIGILIKHMNPFN